MLLRAFCFQLIPPLLVTDGQRRTHGCSPVATELHTTSAHPLPTLMVPPCRDRNLTARRAGPGPCLAFPSPVPKSGDRTGPWTSPQCHLGASGHFLSSRGTNTGTRSFGEETEAQQLLAKQGRWAINPPPNPWHELLIPIS